MTQNSYHHGNLRNALIEAGIELINEVGAEHLSLRKVAARCGVSQAAPYSHFTNKEEMLLATQQYVTDQFMTVLNNAIDTCEDKNDVAVLIQMGKAYVLFFVENPQHFTFLFSQPIMSIDLRLAADGTENFPPYELMKTVTMRVFGNKMSSEKLEDSLISMWATVHGLASIATMKNIRYDKKWEDKIIDIIWNTNR